MGMGACYIRISTDFLSYLKSHPEEIEDIVFENEELEDREFDIDKAWHGIYYLLTGIADLEHPIESTLGLAIFGGTEISEDLGYGPLRYLESEEVKEITTALESVSIRDFASRYNVKDINKYDIYPLDAQWAEEDKEYLIENFESLVEFYRITAKQEEAMLLFIS
ncbi:hypothetical protein AF332_15215 [Sporosarcina globispora]|uniref:DUF1877 domain-containing protein n=1 Tax=Sporosarcina globispora TaxID=1459 RepID=A0A0M0GEW4_SPOGL|nr:YfbM family protein [Sporosarcina globispora]KON88032.1 hypothetical protein AF332_15215 [Sporosarcina globispora]